MMTESLDIVIALKYALSYLVIVVVLLLVFLPKSYKLGILSELLLEINAAYHQNSILHQLGRRLHDRKKPKNLPTMEPYEVVTIRCIRILGLNPGTHTLQGTNTWYIGTSSTKILVDTGEDITSKEYCSFLLDVVFKSTNTERLSDILLTHGHCDHQGGVALLLKELKRRNPNSPLPKVHKRNVQLNDYPCKGFANEHIENNQIFKCKGATLQSIWTPGHTADHVSFILIEDKAILSGDCILGCGTSVFDDLKTYMETLQYLKTIITKENIRSLYPGHGLVIKDALGKVDDYIQHRQLREDQIVSIMKSGKWFSSYALVDLVYEMEKLVLFVKFSAQYNISHVLKKLFEEEKVEKSWPGLYKLK